MAEDSTAWAATTTGNEGIITAIGEILLGDPSRRNQRPFWPLKNLSFRLAPRATPPAVSLATTPYDRELYGGWIDQDGDCQNTRQEVLIEESTRPVLLDTAGCKVVSGRWKDPYTGLVFTDPRRLDIDHFIPLAEVHRSGGHSWTPKQRRQYTNDLSNSDTLIAVSASANRSKRDKDPSRWLPPNKAYHCEYLKTWSALKRHWRLSSDPREKQFLTTSEKFCPE